MFMTNPINEDLQHPIHTSGITVVDSTEEAKVFIHRPDVRSVLSKEAYLRLIEKIMLKIYYHELFFLICLI